MDLEGRTISIDGRRLGYAEFGDPQGRPVVYFHGIPGSRVEAAAVDSEARQRNLRVIAIDRPGIGLSEFQPDRRLVDWPSTITSFADQLGLDKFALVGVSGGGPYVLACALAMPQRLTNAGICCGVPCADWLDKAPGEGVVDYLKQLLAAPRWQQAALWNMLKMTFGVPGGMKILNLPRQALPEVDRRVLSDPQMRVIFDRNVQEAFKGPSDGLLHELHVLTHPWGFDPTDIKIPLRFWYGELDRIVPWEIARVEAGRIATAKVECVAGLGHFSLVLNHIDEILDYLKA